MFNKFWKFLLDSTLSTIKMQTSIVSNLPLNVVALEYPPFSYKDYNGNYDGMEVWLKNSHFKTRTQYERKESNKKSGR